MRSFAALSRYTLRVRSAPWRTLATEIHDPAPGHREKIQRKDAELRLRHEGPVSALEPTDAGDSETEIGRRKRLIWRSGQRGWLEVDLLMGTWAKDNVMGLDTAEMDAYEQILNLETIDIYNLVSGKDALPEEFNTPMMARLQEYGKKYLGERLQGKPLEPYHTQ